MELDDYRQYLNLPFDEKEFVVDAQEIVDFAEACGETAPRFTDPAHPDFQAPPTFPGRFHGRRMLPMDPRELPGLPLDAGKAVFPKAPIRAGTTLVGKSHLHEVYEKTGRSGSMVFLVSRMEIFDPDNTLVSVVDTRIVIRERPEGASK